MNETRNLCAQIPADLHDIVREEKERTEKNLNQYITDLLTEYYHWKEKGKRRKVYRNHENVSLSDTGGTVPED